MRIIRQSITVIAILCLHLFNGAAGAQSANPVSSIQVKLGVAKTDTVDNIVKVFRRIIESRTDARITVADGNGQPGANTLMLELEVNAGMGTEGFKIEGAGSGVIRITGNDMRGLLFGTGKFLHNSRYDDGKFQPGVLRGTSVPVKKVRGIYFATHFYNFYQNAPLDKLEQYVEELALWGINSIMVWFDMHHFNGFDDPEAVELLSRIKTVLRTTKRMGTGDGIALKIRKVLW